MPPLSESVMIQHTPPVPSAGIEVEYMRSLLDEYDKVQRNLKHIHETLATWTKTPSTHPPGWFQLGGVSLHLGRDETIDALASIRISLENSLKKITMKLQMNGVKVK